MFRRILFLLLTSAAVAGCGGGGGGGTGTTTQNNPPAATPTITTANSQNGAVIVSLATTTGGATIYYTLDGTTPTTASPVYEAPFLVAANLTVNAIATAPNFTNSGVGTQAFSLNIPSGTLVWSDEFNDSTGSNNQPNPSFWTYDTGAGGWGNNELENYCAWNSSVSPCDPSNPNVYVGIDGYLHIVATQTASGGYNSARMKSEGRFSFQYGRLEMRAMVPEAQGFWPAGWLLGNSIATLNWPGCGEMDVLERVNGPGSPDWNSGSIHGPGFTGSNIGTQFEFPSGQTAAGWHTYGMIWSKGSVSYYVDDPTQPYASFTPSSISGFSGASWPFDSGPSFIILNLAVGGSWPGPPSSTTPFPSSMLVDYVRIYTN